MQGEANKVDGIFYGKDIDGITFEIRGPAHVTNRAHANGAVATVLLDVGALDLSRATIVEMVQFLLSCESHDDEDRRNDCDRLELAP